MTSAQGLLHGELTEKILKVFFDVRAELGHGFLEIVLHRALLIALKDAGLRAESKMPFVVTFRGKQIGRFWADIVVEGLILIEIKVAPHIEPRHVAQALNYLRISNLEVGLILNFGPSGQFKRVVYANDRKRTAIPSSEVRQENK